MPGCGVDDLKLRKATVTLQHVDDLKWKTLQQLRIFFCRGFLTTAVVTSERFWTNDRSLSSRTVVVFSQAISFQTLRVSRRRALSNQHSTYGTSL